MKRRVTVLPPARADHRRLVFPFRSIRFCEAALRAADSTRALPRPTSRFRWTHFSFSGDGLAFGDITSPASVVARKFTANSFTNRSSPE